MTQEQTVEKQVAMVFDLNKCLGCQTCTIACKTLWTDQPGMEHMWWNIVNTLPGDGTPKGWHEMGGGFEEEKPVAGTLPSRAQWGEAWEFNYEEVYYGGKGESVHLKPKGGDPAWGPNWDEDQGAGEYPNSYYFYVQRLCNHCTKPACLEACPRQAIYKRPKDGIVLVDEERCHGYRYCIEACPYKRIYFNLERLIAQKCVFCFPRVEQGVAPACARQCPGRIRHVDYLDDEDGHVYKLVTKWKVALRLFPQRGTEPNIYYVPPLAPPRFDKNGDIDESQPRIPNEYLEYLFGPDVHQALATLKEEMEKRRRGEESELMDLLIGYRWTDLMGPFAQNPAKLHRPA
jgi:ethylbenzene hydroxylase subunit beta/complex iron-sulfur molybdoenzyme family reductase subunit beta